MSCSSKVPKADRNDRVCAEYCLAVAICIKSTVFKILERTSGPGRGERCPVDVSANGSSSGHLP